MGIVFNNNLNDENPDKLPSLIYELDDDILFDLYSFELDENRNYVVSQKLVIDLIDNNELFKHLHSMLTVDGAYACNIINKNTNSVIKITKSQLHEALRKVNSSIINRERFAFVLYATSVDCCYEYYDQYDTKYKCIIDGVVKQVSTKKLLDIITYNDKDFDKFINNRMLLPYPIEEMIYILIDFVNKTNVLDMYYFTEEQRNRINELMNYKYVDYESVNKFNNPNVLNKDSMNSKYEISDELKKEVIEGIDPSYDDLEKAIYIYIRLCDILSYDEKRVYSDNSYIKEELDYDRIASIDIENNKVVSSEFALILAKLLFELGFKVQPHIDCVAGFNKEHAYISFKQGEFLSKIDVFNNSIIRNDMSMVKIGGSLSGITCLNNNQTTNNKFSDKVDKVYSKYVRVNRKEEAIDDGKVKYYEGFTNGLSISDDVRIALDSISETNLIGIELINYIQELISTTVLLDDYIKYETISSRGLGDTYNIVYLIISVEDKKYIVNLYSRKIEELSELKYNVFKTNTNVLVNEYDNKGIKLR